MIDVQQIETYYRSKGCTCAIAPVRPGDEHDSSCQMLFEASGLRERLKRILLVLRVWTMVRGFGRACMWMVKEIELRGRNFARRIRRSSLGGEWHRPFVGASFPLTKFLCSGANRL